jgi:uncharacterized protein YkwD
MEIPKKKSYRLHLLVAGLIALVVLFIAHPTLTSDLKRILSFDRDTLIESIKREISNSGKLISEATQRGADLSSDGIFSFTNEERHLLGLTPFFSSVSLNQVANRRLNDMFEEGYFEHVSPSGKSAVSEAEVVGYEYISIGENIALGNFAGDEALVEAWMNSPGHRANIVSEKFTILGVATRKGMFEGRETWIAVQIFARPLSDCPSVDSSLRQTIEGLNIRIKGNHQELDIRKDELDELERNPSARDEYERKVEEYNTLVGETNRMVQEVENMTSRYNVGVRAFNACLEK